MCQKIITEPLICQKRTYKNAVLEVDCQPDHKKPFDCEKSTRAAMITTRFAETILKSQQKLVLNHCNDAEKKICKAKNVNIEATIRAAKIALKNRRQKEREAARLAIDSIQTTVEWNDALRVTEEFEKLIGVHKCPARSFTRDFFQW